MPYSPQDLVKRLPQFEGNYLLPEDFIFSPTFKKLDFYSFNNPTFFQKLIEKLNRIDFYGDFIFSFITPMENNNYLIFTNQNHFVLIDLNFFSNVSSVISNILSKQKNSNFISLNNTNDEDKLKKLFPEIHFNFIEVASEKKVLIDNLFHKLFTTQEIINFTIFTKVVLEFFSTLIILSNSNSNLNSILNILDADIEYKIGQFYESRNTTQETEIAYNYYLKSSNKGNSNSIFKIGFINEKRGNIELAIEFYKKIENENYSEGIYRLSLLLLSNSNVLTKQILDSLDRSAKNGNSIDSQILLGDLYNNTKKYANHPIDRNMAKSFNYYLMAAENGSKEAFKKMQKLFIEDKDEVILDTTIEYRYLKLSADNNNSAEEQYQLGLIYKDDSDIDNAICYLEKASDQGHYKSRIELALLFKNILRNKSKMNINSIKSLKLYPTDESLLKKIKGLLSSMADFDVDAQFNLGMIYVEENDPFQARIYLLKAAENDHIESLYQVGLLHMKSKEDGQKNLIRATEYLKKASDNGYSDADVRLGDIYSNKNSSTHYDLDKAIMFYTKASNNGNADAQAALGDLYSNNESPQYNIQKAIDYYRLACKNGNPTGLSRLGRFYYNGVNNYLTADYKSAFELLFKAANMYDKYAQFNVGLMKYFGHGCNIDIPDAINWLIKASEHDDNSFTEPMFKLGLLYINELKPPYNPNMNTIQYNYGAQFVSPSESVKWFTKASKKGNIEASLMLGKMYRKGRHVKKDINKAIEFYEDAANRNNQKALYRLALIHYEGKATTTLDDIDKAVDLLQILARSGHIKARIKLAEIYTRPFPKVTRNEDIASDHFSSINKYDINSTNIYKSKYYTRENITEAIETLKQFYQADLNAKAILGEILYKGILLKVNLNLALKYLTEAAQSGNSDSLLFLGRIYYKGVHITKDKEKAIKYLTQSAQLKNVKAENKLGKIYFLDQNYSESLYWFTQAAQHGYDVAQYNLGLFYLENRGPKFPKRIQQGLQNLEVAATQNYLPALLKLGDFYYKGSYYNDEHFYYHSKISIPNPQYLSAAITYYKRAADLKSIKAMIKLGEIYERGLDYKLLFNQKECINMAISYYEKAYLLGFNLYENNHPKMSKEEQEMLYKDRTYVFPAVKLALFQRNNEKVSCIENKKALQILLEASRKDNVAAINFFAKLYYYSNYENLNIDANKKREDAINLFTKASKLGSKKAKIHLALYYLSKHDYQSSFNLFNEILILIQNEHQNPKKFFDVDFEYDLIEKDYDLYASFFCQLLSILNTNLSIDTSKWALNYNEQIQVAKYHHENDLKSDFYDGLFDFNDFDNDVMHFQYYNNNNFSFNTSVMYKSFMRDSLCLTNNYNSFFSKLIQFIELFRHDKEFLDLHSGIINKLSKISYQLGNSKTLLECAVLLDNNVTNNNISNYDCFAHLYKIDIKEVLNINSDEFDHSQFAQSLYNFIMEKIPLKNSVKCHQMAALNLSNYLPSDRRYRLISPYAHNGVEFAIRKLCNDFPNFTNIFRSIVVKVEVAEDQDDKYDDFKFQCKYESINFNKPDDRKKAKLEINNTNVNIISDMKRL